MYLPSLSHTRLYRLHIMNGKNNLTLTLTLYREIIDMIFCYHIVAPSSDIDHNRARNMLMLNKSLNKVSTALFLILKCEATTFTA